VVRAICAQSSFDDLFKEDGIFEAVQGRALKRALAEGLPQPLTPP
jgi:hypothetical protein